MRRMVADGAMGTELLARTGFNGLPAVLNLAAPDLVRTLHREYVDAGAQLLVTNTIGATPDQAEAGVRLARMAASACHPERSEDSSLAVVAMAFGQDASSPGASQGDIQIGASLVAAPAPSQDLIRALVAADLVLVETVTSLRPLETAAAAIRHVTDKPVWATFSFDAGGKLDGLPPAAVASEARRLELAAFGYGCGVGLQAARAVLAELRQATPDATLIARPNLGLPHDGRYDVTPEAVADWAHDMSDLGVDIIGLCCGSTPAHVGAIASQLRSDC